jgi:hypothetical protein
MKTACRKRIGFRLPASPFHLEMEWTSHARRISSAAYWGDATRTWLGPEDKYPKVTKGLLVGRAHA